MCKLAYSEKEIDCQPMAHEALAFLIAPLATLPGVGEARAALLARAVGGERIIDLLFHLPESYVDRRKRQSVAELTAGSVATLMVEVVRCEPPERPRQPWRVVVADASGFAELVYFSKPVLWERFAPGKRFLVSGRVESYQGRPSIPHPDYVLPPERADTLPAIEPIWPLTAGLSRWQVRKAVQAALARLPPLPEWQDPALLRRERWMGFAEALVSLQEPKELPSAEPRRRLAYDELLARQVALALSRARLRARAGRALSGDGRLRAEAEAAFGFTPTASQRHALAEIDADLAAPRRMLRLLQGDVGSGKTWVAVMAMLRAVEAGAQAALMAPTEILARQHFATLQRVTSVPVALLTSSVRGEQRRRVLAGLASGEIPLVVGTHALFQQAVSYHDLGLIVIDEQHRFGVYQRLLLGAKGKAADVLVMTATPIPRTLLLTQWGEVDISRLQGKPSGRQPVRTTLHSLAALEEVIAAIARALQGGANVYWICPLVAESEASDVAAAEARYASLRERFGPAVGLAHGRMEPARREAVLTDFAAGRIRLLVATTVVEVGVDVPAANVMVIEHAERFGLAQLHQLRGRVGRGNAESFCLLLHDAGLTEVAAHRLRLLRDIDDGFRIADEDFRLRGGGEILGTRQSGQPLFRIAEPVSDEGLLHMAHRDAAVLLARDPELTSPRGRAVRLLLRLFNPLAASRTLLSG